MKTTTEKHHWCASLLCAVMWIGFTCWCGMAHLYITLAELSMNVFGLIVWICTYLIAYGFMGIVTANLFQSWKQWLCNQFIPQIILICVTMGVAWAFDWVRLFRPIAIFYTPDPFPTLLQKNSGMVFILNYTFAFIEMVFLQLFAITIRALKNKIKSKKKE